MSCLQDPPQGVEQARYHFQALQVPGWSVAAWWLIPVVPGGASTIPTLQVRANDLSNLMRLPDGNANHTDKAGMVVSSGKEKLVFGHIFFGFSL